MSEADDQLIGRQGAPAFARDPLAGVALLGATTSIASLVLYLIGVAEFALLLRWVLLPGALMLLGALVLARRRGQVELHQRITAGLWAGLLATFTYDLVRVPAVLAGMPVFKAISYFGTVMLNQATPTLASEFAGWTYHLSNGVGFGLMYVLLWSRPSWWSALLWGLSLEGLMLLTPYAEVFGYRVSTQFLAITITAHLVYGLTLWAALVYWLGGAKFGAATLRRTALLVWPGAVSLAAVGLIAADFHARYASAIPPSPPEFLGRHLYTTWDVAEPDRVVAAWIWQRFVDRQAQFSFVTPFSRIARGRPFDTPEASVRRSATRSATENLLAAYALDPDPALSKLGRMTHLYEITPWMVAADPEAHELGRALTRAVAQPSEAEAAASLHRGFQWLNTWYNAQSLPSPQAGQTNR